MEELPASHDALAEEALRGESTPPEERPLARSYMGRGKGALLALGVLGLAAFFAPWVDMRSPEIATYSAFELARGRAGWLWGGAVGWFVLLPLVWTRRSIRGLRGVRLIAAMFASMTLLEVVMMVALPPQSRRLIPIDYSWAWGLYMSATVSVLGVFFAARLGGRIDDLPALPWRDRDGKRRIEHSEGETLH